MGAVVLNVHSVKNHYVVFFQPITFLTSNNVDLESVIIITTALFCHVVLFYS